jgi:hypothetical protein
LASPFFGLSLCRSLLPCTFFCLSLRSSFARQALTLCFSGGSFLAGTFFGLRLRGSFAGKTLAFRFSRCFPG